VKVWAERLTSCIESLVARNINFSIPIFALFNDYSLIFS
jgi:hypothetical protein